MLSEPLSCLMMQKLCSESVDELICSIKKFNLFKHSDLNIPSSFHTPNVLHIMCLLKSFFFFFLSLSFALTACLLIMTFDRKSSIFFQNFKNRILNWTYFIDLARAANILLHLIIFFCQQRVYFNWCSESRSSPAFYLNITKELIFNY